MAITMSGATVSADTRDALLNSSVEESSVTAGGERANASGWFGNGEATGAALAGVTEGFSSAFNDAVESYKATVTEKLEELSNVESNSAFKGSGISASLTKFIDSVKEVANSYLDKLTEAENEIAAGVAAAYATQDTDLSGQMNTDSSTLEGQSVSA